MNLFSHLKFYLLFFVKCYTDAASYVEVLMLKKTPTVFKTSKSKKKILFLNHIASEQKACSPMICSENVLN